MAADPCACAEHAETFWALATSLPHWELEGLIVVLIDGILLGLAMPFLKRHLRHHLARDKREGVR